MKSTPKRWSWTPGLLLLSTLSWTLALSSSSASGQSEGPVGSQFQINTNTPGFQAGPRIAAAEDGKFMVVYLSQTSPGDDSSGYSVLGQLFAAHRGKIGSEIQVNSYTTSQQQWPTVTSTGDGFLVVWSSNGSAFADDQGFSIQGQRFAADGDRLGGEFEINTVGTGNQDYPVVAANDTGFVVAWASEGADGAYSSSIRGRRFTSDGTPLGDELAVSEGTMAGVESPAVAQTADGGFVVAWASNNSTGTDNSSTSVQARRFDSSGIPLGPAFQVNTYTTDRQFRPDVAPAQDGGFAVVWTSFGSPGDDQDGPSVQSQRFDGDGMPMGSQLQVNAYTLSFQVGPGLVPKPDGGFVVVWESLGSAGDDSSDRSIQARHLDAAGEPIGEQFQVNLFTTSYQLLPRVAADASGDFTIVWNSNGSPGDDSDSLSIQGQRFGLRIFADGFESGDTSAWTQANSRGWR